MEEIARAGSLVQALSGVAKLNIGALGNKVPQLHIHVVGRRQGDPAWPGPVWGHSPAVPYEADALARILGLVRAG
jgi:diadenosine tetraphosphate (Ap4A) HIT family hydrolase